MNTKLRTGAILLLVSLFGGCTAGTDDGAASQPDPAARCLCRGWADHPANPLIEPPKLEWIVGDPTFLTPGRGPDDRWHLFANTILTGLYHYTSADGVSWEQASPKPPIAPAMRPFLFLEGGRYHLLYEKLDGVTRSHIELRTSADLNTWSDPTTILEATLDWERTVTSETVGNPFVHVDADGRYALYYSAGGKLQDDTGFFEPMYIGLAHADKLTGPYTKRAAPIIRPSAAVPYRNQAAGSIKLLDERWRGRLLALNNWIYTDANQQSRSAIFLVSSADGVDWTPVCPEPVIAPDPADANSFRHAFVYASQARRVGDRLWVFYNARDGWVYGPDGKTTAKERIGLATKAIPADLSDAEACTD